jgi:hypothetical protein
MPDERLVDSFGGKAAYAKKLKEVEEVVLKEMKDDPIASVNFKENKRLFHITFNLEVNKRMVDLADSRCSEFITRPGGASIDLR